MTPPTTDALSFVPAEIRPQREQVAANIERMATIDFDTWTKLYEAVMRYAVNGSTDDEMAIVEARRAAMDALELAGRLGRLPEDRSPRVPDPRRCPGGVRREGRHRRP